MYMSVDEIRNQFLKFFKNKNHKIIESSPLILDNDSSILFTNAGMNQFKDHFLGITKRKYARVATAQRCVRAGGKHNDLNNVGFTTHHHTFFEMLGNFSFGDYFKEEAIIYAWTFLTEVLQLSPDKFVVTVHCRDDETFNIWKNKINIPSYRIIRIGNYKDSDMHKSGNFWTMGDTGPCGPCTEIFYDYSANFCKKNSDKRCPINTKQLIEVWNNVFMQFNRCADNTMNPLSCLSVDTGMGIERIAAIMQGVRSNYDIDIFKNLITAAADVTGYQGVSHQSLCVIADHIRSCSFLISDGVSPANEGRGYVLRRIIRRAIRHGYKLGSKGLFFYKLVDVLSEVMGDISHNIKRQKDFIKNVIRIEEELFNRTFDRGMWMLKKSIKICHGNILDGLTVFKLYDTYGFPLDVIKDITIEHNIKIDIAGFYKLMAQQRKRGRMMNKFSNNNDKLKLTYKTTFQGYTLENSDTIVLQVYKKYNEVALLSVGEQGIIILKQTPFYPEGGGQCSDIGIIKTAKGRFNVQKVQKHSDTILHYGKIVHGYIQQNDAATSIVDSCHRLRVSANHSATHLLHSALCTILGNHIMQKGSLVNSQRLRFDFSHASAVTPNEIQAVERLVNKYIFCNYNIIIKYMDVNVAKQQRAKTLLHQQYDNVVRVVRIGNCSTELCGGTHVSHTGNIGLCKIVAECSVSSGVRRIEAFTRNNALNSIDAENIKHQQIIDKHINKIKYLEKTNQNLKKQLLSLKYSNIKNNIEMISGIPVLIQELYDTDSNSLHHIIDTVKKKLSSCVIILANIFENKINVIVSVTRDLTTKVPADALIRTLISGVGGKGGGHHNIAAAGDIKKHKLSKVFQLSRLFITKQRIK